jgi:hypothetical protein
VKHGPFDEQIGRRDLTAYISRDDGKTWEGGLLLEDRPCSYPDGFQAGDGRIYVIYDRSRRGDKQIKMAVFTEADALAGQQVSDHLRTKVLVNQATGILSESAEYTNFESVFHDNKDGEARLSGAAAEWVLEGEMTIEPFVLGARIFTNRNYELAQLREGLDGSHFIRSAMGEVEAVCTKAGVVYVVTPSYGRNQHSLHNELIDMGFVKVAIPEFLLFRRNGLTNACSVYQKRVAVGERLSFSFWSVMVIPPF